MSLPEPRYTLVREPTDAPDRATFLRALGRPSEGRVVAEIRPGARGLQWIAAAMMEGLGKDLAHHGGRRAGLTWRRVSDWLVGYEATDIFVSRVQTLKANEWQLLIELAAETNATLWLIVQQRHLTRTQRDLVGAWPFQELSWHAFEERWKAVASSAGASANDEATADDDLKTADDDLYPDIPDDDFTTFLSTAKRLLPRSAFGRVEAAFDLGHSSAAPLRDDNCAGWASVARTLVDGADSWREALARVRGAQTAFFLRGHWLRVTQPTFTLNWEARAACSLSPALCDALERLPLEQWAAIATLRAATHAGPADLAAIRIGDVKPDAVRMNGAWQQLPKSAEVFVRTQLASRLRDGVGSSDSFFCGQQFTESEDAPTPVTVRGVQRTLRALGNEIGIELIERKSSWTSDDDDSWARHHGLSLRSLAEKSDG